MRQRCEFQDIEIRKSAKKVQEAMALAAEESSKSKAAKDVIGSLTAQVPSLLVHCSLIPPLILWLVENFILVLLQCLENSIHGEMACITQGFLVMGLM